MFSYAIDSARQRIDAHVGAQTSGAELLQGMEELLADPMFDSTFGILIDLRDLQRAPTVAEMAELANFVRSRSIAPDARRAFVTASPVFLGLAQLFTRLARGAAARYRAFRSTEDAESWLAGDAVDSLDGDEEVHPG